MTQYIVAARIDENGRASGGAVGDQTGREVTVQTLSSSGKWTSILRPHRNASVIVQQAFNAAANDNIGYDQSNRTSLYSLAKASGWNLSKVGRCECDCSSLVAVLANCAGYPVSKDMYTGNERSVLKSAGWSQIAYSASVLRPGDVLWRSGHTGVYVGTLPYYTYGSQSSNTHSSGSGSIKSVQQWANSYANAGLNVDGINGPKTRRGLCKCHQKAIGAVPDGIWGSETRGKTKVLKKGSTGNDVKVLQGALICLGYDTGGFDGIFGSKTDAATRSYQRSKGLSVDGQAGKATFGSLFG